VLAATIVPLLGAEMQRRNSQLAEAGDSAQNPQSQGQWVLSRFFAIDDLEYPQPVRSDCVALAPRQPTLPGSWPENIFGSLSSFTSHFRFHN